MKRKSERLISSPQRSRIKARSVADPSEMGLPSSSSEEAYDVELREETRRKPIVSINGQDVDEDELRRSTV
jgi:hypothetical protein